jgi:phosphoribosylformylglycinamidine cyclo-ligase
MSTITPSKKADRYQVRGVTDKQAVHSAIQKLDQGLFPGAFCKILPDYLDGDPEKCILMHPDGSGSKMNLAYLVWKLTGDLSVFDRIVQDSIVMNLDDAACAGFTGPFLVSSTIARNPFNVPGEVIERLITATAAFCEKMTCLGIPCYPSGGETADLPNQTGTLIIDHTITGKMRRDQVIDASRIDGSALIVGFSSTGRASWEDVPNSSMGSNGLTSAIHDSLCPEYLRHPETFGRELPISEVYAGPYKIGSKLPGGKGITIADALLSPTRTYAPLAKKLFDHIDRTHFLGLIHCSGGGQTKTGNFGKDGIEYVKDNLFPIPPLFEMLIKVRKLSIREAFKTYNMGHRFEAIVRSMTVAETCIHIAKECGIKAMVIGEVRKNFKLPKLRRVRIKTSEVNEKWDF